MAMSLAESHYDLLRDAIFDDSVERFEELLSVPGIDVDHFDAGGQTLLHLASFWGRMAIVKVLLNAGASLKVKNAAGCTALDLSIHWGHSSVAEIIRLRGGRSVWEEKMGQLQIRVEDLKLMNTQLTQQWQDKRKQYDQLLDDFHALHKRFEEEKSAHQSTKDALKAATEDNLALRQQNQELQTQLNDKTEEYRVQSIEKARSEYLQAEAHRELEAALAHRDEVIKSMQASVRKQEELTAHWKQAEMAAAMADSQRNFALAEKEKLHKQHGATLGELLLTTERLHAAEQELMTLRVELGEYIFLKEKDDRILRRAARFLQRKEGITTPDLVLRPTTVPANVVGDIANDPEPLGPVLNTKKRSQFPLAAREFGDKMRHREQKKSNARQRRHQAVENQFLTEGLHTPIIAADKFQEAFVSSLNAFATTRQDKWIQLQRDRDQQISFANNVVARRGLATAPAPAFHRPGSDGLGRTRPGRQPNDESDPSSAVETKPPRSNLAPLRRKNSMNLVVYTNEDGPDRPVTSHAEQRLRGAFFQDRRSSIEQTKDPANTPVDLNKQ